MVHTERLAAKVLLRHPLHVGSAYLLDRRDIIAKSVPFAAVQSSHTVDSRALTGALEGDIKSPFQVGFSPLEFCGGHALLLHLTHHAFELT